MRIPFVMTLESITVYVDGETFQVLKDTPNYYALRDALYEERWDDVPALLTLGGVVEEWGDGRFTLEGDTFYIDGDEVPANLNARLLAMVNNNEDPTPWLCFWELLRENPSRKSVETLYNFMEHENIPVDQDGYIIAYKGIRDDYTDWYSGTFDNSPGQVHEMPRNKVMDDPSVGCSYGFHVGSLDYALGLSTRTVVCRVHPADVVSVPYDCQNKKMRCSKYEVLAEYTRPLPSTSVTVSDGDFHAPRQTSAAAKWHRFDDYDADVLGSFNMDDLRKYAREVLGISNANNIRGGKENLINAIYRKRGW